MDTSLIRWTLNCITARNNATTPPPHDLREEIERIKSLPPLPGIASKIMKLASDPLADAQKLAEIVEIDPLLSTQVIRWASSALYGYKGKITSVHDAITRVLGYQFVFNLVLGLASLAPLKAPMTGKIGTRSFWIHALASIQLMNVLNESLPHEQKIDPQHVFFAAFIHNIGFPLMGYQFIDKFNKLSTLIDANSDLSLIKLEQFALGITHCELGSWLLQTWDMPKPIIDVVYHHHNPYYRGENQSLNLLTFLNDCLLSQISIGDAHPDTEYQLVFEHLKIDQDGCDTFLQKVFDDLENIKATVEVCVDNK